MTGVVAVAQRVRLLRAGAAEGVVLLRPEPQQACPPVAEAEDPKGEPPVETLVDIARRYSLVSPFTSLYVPSEDEPLPPRNRAQTSDAPTSPLKYIVTSA